MCECFLLIWPCVFEVTLPPCTFSIESVCERHNYGIVGVLPFCDGFFYLFCLHYSCWRHWWLSSYYFFLWRPYPRSDICGDEMSIYLVLLGSLSRLGFFLFYCENSIAPSGWRSSRVESSTTMPSSFDRSSSSKIHPISSSACFDSILVCSRRFSASYSTIHLPCMSDWSLRSKKKLFFSKWPKWTMFSNFFQIYLSTCELRHFFSKFARSLFLASFRRFWSSSILSLIAAWMSCSFASCLTAIANTQVVGSTSPQSQKLRFDFDSFCPSSAAFFAFKPSGHKLLIYGDFIIGCEYFDAFFT